MGGGGVPEGVEARVRGVLDGLAGRDVDLFLVRLRRWWGDLAEGLGGPYGERQDLGALLDRVAGTLEGVGEHLDYIGELGVRYLHLMPLLAPREGDSDGGYAVRDYRAVEPRLGTMDDLERLCGLARGRGISVCVDLVLNHCAAEHAWAVAARAGDPEAQAMFWMFGDRELPDAYERTLPEVFPDFAPGNF